MCAPLVLDAHMSGSLKTYARHAQPVACTPCTLAGAMSPCTVAGTLTQVLAEELAPRIRVNAIGPGPILPQAGQTEDEFRARCARLPLQRPASLSEACDSVRFLIAQRAITGQLIALDGGDHFNGHCKTAP